MRLRCMPAPLTLLMQSVFVSVVLDGALALHLCSRILSMVSCPRIVVLLRGNTVRNDLCHHLNEITPSI